MSREAWGDDDSDGHEGYVVNEYAEGLMIGAAQVMREMLARFVEQGGNSIIAESIRANWIPSWGKDPGKWEGPIPEDIWQVGP